MHAYHSKSEGNFNEASSKHAIVHNLRFAFFAPYDSLSAIAQCTHCSERTKKAKGLASTSMRVYSAQKHRFATIERGAKLSEFHPMRSDSARLRYSTNSHKYMQHKRTYTQSYRSVCASRFNLRARENTTPRTEAEVRRARPIIMLLVLSILTAFLVVMSSAASNSEDGSNGSELEVHRDEHVVHNVNLVDFPDARSDVDSDLDSDLHNVVTGDVALDMDASMKYLIDYHVFGIESKYASRYVGGDPMTYRCERFDDDEDYFQSTAVFSAKVLTAQHVHGLLTSCVLFGTLKQRGYIEHGPVGSSRLIVKTRERVLHVPPSELVELAILLRKFVLLHRAGVFKGSFFIFCCD